MVVFDMPPGGDADDIAATVPAEPGEVPAFDGGKVGRYLLLREIGRGAMGVVFAGFDPDLGRRVAVKLVGDAREAVAPYLLREARMLATISHPNIVPVFDVGQDGNRLYIVMELVDGMSLAAWLGEASPRARRDNVTPRSPRDIVRVWCAAGRGLAAAHAAGVAHRDFKASNVLIGNDGHVRVADFGLARAIDDADVDSAVEGTRGYMAPEAAMRGVASEAVDQYAFCVSLYHALTGLYPAARVDDTKLPRRLRRVLVRGLAADPGARWPAMDVLVAELERTQRMPRAVWVAAGAAGVVAIAGAGGLVLAGGHQRSCESADAVVERVVPAATRAKLAKAVRDGSEPQADELARTIGRLVDDGLAAWSTAHAAACGLPERTACLAARLDELAMIVDDTITEHENQSLLDVPMQLAAWRGDVPACSGRAMPAAESGAYHHAMARAVALIRLGRSGDAIAAAERAIAAAHTPATRIRAQIRRLVADDKPNLATFDALATAASATGDRELMADVAAGAAQQCVEMPTPNCAPRWIAQLADVLAQLPADAAPQQRADLVGLRGEQALLDGNATVALPLFADEVRRVAAVRGEDSIALLPGLADLGHAQFELKRYTDAIATATRVDAIIVKWLGAEHPYRANALTNRGGAKLKTDDIAGGVADLEHALALRVQLEGEDSPRLAGVYNNLAAGYQAMGRPALALPLVDRSIAQFAKTPGIDNGRQLATIRNGALLAAILGRPDARTRIDSVFTLARERLAPEHPDWALLYQTRGHIAVRTGDYATAARDLAEAITRYDRMGERAAIERALTHGMLALLALHRQQLPVAERELARAYELAVGLSPRSIKRAWLDALAIDLAIARHDDSRARTKLVPLAAYVAAGDADREPRVVAHVHALGAVLAERARDASAAAAARERAAATLRGAGIAEDALLADCPVCATARPR